MIYRHKKRKSLKVSVCSRLNEAVFLKSPKTAILPNASHAHTHTQKKETYIQLPSGSLTTLYVYLANDFLLTNDGAHALTHTYIHILCL